MQYRGKEYSVVKGIKPGTWKWTVRLDENNVRTGVDKTRSAAMESVGRLVDRALAPKKVKLTTSSGPISAPAIPVVALGG
jgi:hypothetical protein